MTAVDYLAAAVYLLVVGLAARWLLRRCRAQRRAQVFRDITRAREARRAHDLAVCQLIWPDPPSARVIEAQWRHDTAKQQKEEQ